MYSIIKAKHYVTLQHKIIFSELIWVIWNGLVQYSNDWQTWYKIPKWIIWAAGLWFLPPFMGWASPNRKGVLSCNRQLQDSSLISFNRRWEIRSNILGHLFIYRCINFWYAIHFCFLCWSLILLCVFSVLLEMGYDNCKRSIFPNATLSNSLIHPVLSVVLIWAISELTLTSVTPRHYVYQPEWFPICITSVNLLTLLQTNSSAMEVPHAGLYWFRNMLVQKQNSVT